VAWLRRRSKSEPAVAPLLDLSLDELLTTTRTVRRRLDLNRPVDPALVRECLEIALQAPTGSNAQSWHWIVVTDPDQRARIAEVYGRAFDAYRRSPGFAGRLFAADPERSAVQRRVGDSAEYLAEHLDQVPVLVLPCLWIRAGGRLPEGNQASTWGSLLPAVWNYMLAARARGLGTALTTLHLAYEGEVAEILGMPPDVRQGALVPTAHTVGTDFSRARRRPLEEVLHWDEW